MADRSFALPRDLGNGLTLRLVRPDDADQLALFNASIHGDPAHGPDDEAAIWTRDLLRGDHPVGDVSGTIVEEVATQRIVSSCLLIPQVWSYDGVAVNVGRPELVGTHDDYRRRGLIRLQFDVVHRWSTDRGHLMQALTGIPHYYRQFGYEPSLIIPGGRVGFPDAYAETAPGGIEGYRVRPAEHGDLSLILGMDRQAAERSLLSAVRDEALWRYEIFDRDPRSDYRHDVQIIESRGGEAVGVLANLNRLRRGGLFATMCEVREGIAWPEIAPFVLAALRRAGEAIARRDGEEFVLVGLDMVVPHPLQQLLRKHFPVQGRQFAWHVRVEDPPSLVRHVAPALDRRLANSIFAAYSGEVNLTFFRSGLRLILTAGQVDDVESWQSPSYREADAGFPERTFIQLLLGSRSMEELEYAFPDCWAKTDSTRLLLDTLFPKKPSLIWPIA